MPIAKLKSNNQKLISLNNNISQLRNPRIATASTPVEGLEQEISNLKRANQELQSNLGVCDSEILRLQE